ncbi:hypothetical protein Tco_0138152 [Tanacetum coccineum]
MVSFPTRAFHYQGRISPGNTVTNPKEEIERSQKDNAAPRTRQRKHHRRPTSRFNQSRNQISKPDVESVSAPKVSIPFPSRRNDEKSREKANEQIEKFYEIFKDMNFEI